MGQLKSHPEDPLSALARIASKKHLAEISYVKGVTRHNVTARIVEPYSLSQGKQDAMVKCYQLDPKEGWRFFMMHKIGQVRDTGERFEPRARITLATGRTKERFEPAPGWTDELKCYRSLVADALADGLLTASELAEIEQFKKDYNISLDQVRFVHTTIFHRCLGSVIEDGKVDSLELRQIRFLNRVLSKLGWTVGE